VCSIPIAEAIVARSPTNWLLRQKSVNMEPSGLLAFKLTHSGAIAPALHWQGRGRRPRPLPASPCAASAPYPHQLPSRARGALVSCRLSTDLHSFRFAFACPRIPRPHSDIVPQVVRHCPRVQPPRSIPGSTWKVTGCSSSSSVCEVGRWRYSPPRWVR